MLTCVVVLLVLTINLAVSFGLVIGLYLIAISPLREELKRVAATTKKPQPEQGQFYYQMSPQNDLPDMEDVPADALYGEEGEDYKTTPEEVEDALAQREPVNYNRPRTTSAQQLGSLKM